MEGKQNPAFAKDDGNVLDVKKEKENEAKENGGSTVSKERNYFPFWFLVFKTVVTVTSWTATVSICYFSHLSYL